MNDTSSRKISIINNVKLIEENNNKYVIKKKKNNDIKELFSYLRSKNFINYLDYINDDKERYMIFPYINNVIKDKDEIGKDLVILISSLHAKTSFYKRYTEYEAKSFYEEKIEYLEYIDKYYDDLRLKIEEQEFISPSNYLLLRNISWIFHSINSCRYFLEKWYEIIKNKKNRRICLIHGNLEFDHLLEDENKFIISWDNARNDIPIYDLLGLYKKHFNEVYFYNLFKIYEECFQLLEEERYLLFSLMLLPEKLNLDQREILNTKSVFDLIEYLKTSSNIISKYHSKNSDYKTNEQ